MSDGQMPAFYGPWSLKCTSRGVRRPGDTRVCVLFHKGLHIQGSSGIKGAKCGHVCLQGLLQALSQHTGTLEAPRCSHLGQARQASFRVLSTEAIVHLHCWRRLRCAVAWLSGACLKTHSVWGTGC